MVPYVASATGVRVFWLGIRVSSVQLTPSMLVHHHMSPERSAIRTITSMPWNTAIAGRKRLLFPGICALVDHASGSGACRGPQGRGLNLTTPRGVNPT